MLVIKVRTSKDKVLFVEYNLDQDQDYSSLETDKNATVFSQTGDYFMVACPKIGVINLETKEIH